MKTDYMIKTMHFIEIYSNRKNGLKCCSGFKWDLHLEACIGKNIINYKIL